jgi:hypothetical protein
MTKIITWRRVEYSLMEAMLKLYALIVLPAAIAFMSGALIYVALPEQPLVAATLGPLIGVSVVGGGMLFGVDQWAMRTVRRHWPWSDSG